MIINLELAVSPEIVRQQHYRYGHVTELIYL